ncbi:putative secreted protein (Por secretion system target) [Winogradskyella epiphytica]|uniref:Putative secreted protein (Por secretion system target) n=1 Tax=Winogradskyella epiphytica TaxID=262005 RepID=A0A2V4XHQ5_9FLAO|nr:CUB domain-containing protein [Winogradskyella epiphytica]PYE80763.1 putative secreted protein (Por secretion system target) [Winogradskyella epiphytica]GGW68293.1 hypothetical protein GCM10008085_20270 [Winogradskyella epiphytica]
MKKITLLLIFVTLFCQNNFAQGDSVANAEQFCAGGSELVFPNVTGETNWTDVGCLGSIPNAAYYYITIAQPGDLIFNISQTDVNGDGLDVDFIAWGPFNSIADADASITLTDCATCPSNTSTTEPNFYPYTPDHIVDCSYDAAPAETLTITGAQTGEIYIVLITNYGNKPGSISLQQTGGTGATSCKDLPVCGNKFYDSGGETGDYSNNLAETTTIYPFEAGGTVTTTFTVFDIAPGDSLAVYDGPDTSAPSLGTYSGTTNPGPFTSTHASGTLTFVFTSNGSGVGAGWAADIVCTPPPLIPTCGDTFYDSGGVSGDYTNNENETTVIAPINPGDAVTTTFTAFNLDSGDTLEVFDGATSLGSFTGTTIPGPFTSTDPSGELTFTFTSNGGGTQSGWAADITCSILCNISIAEALNPIGADDCTLNYSQFVATSLGSPGGTTTVFSEDFRGTSIPTGWTVNNSAGAGSWTVTNSSNAGGTPYEGTLSGGYDSSANGTVSLTSPPINIAGQTNLQLDLKQYLDHYGSSYFYSISIQTSLDGAGWVNQYNVNPVTNDINQETRNIDLFALSGNSLRIRFQLNGMPFGLSYWYIDDIILTGDAPPVIPQITWSPTTGLYTDASLTTAYTGGFTDTVYAAPNGTQTYTATDQNGCSDTVTVSRNKKIWNGSINTDWFNSSNWTPIGIPTNQNCVIIPDANTTNHSPIVDSATSPGLGKTLLVETNGYLEVESESGLIITDDITVDGKLILRNSSNLVQITNTGITNTGNIQMQRTVNDLSPQDYVYWSSPVDDFSVTAVSPGSNQRYKWLPTTAAKYGNWQATSEIMEPAKGYIIRGISGTNPEGVAPTNTVEFTGVPRNGRIQIPIMHGGYTGADYTGAGNTDATELDDNWNLIGNPYPSSISADLFIAVNGGTLSETPDPNTPAIFGTVYLWTHTSAPSTIDDPFYGDYVYNYNPNDYIGYNSTGSNPAGFNGYIAAGQAFFVLMDHNASSPSMVTFNNTMRYDNSTPTNPLPFNNTQFYRAAPTAKSLEYGTEIEKHRIWLDLISPNNRANSILVGYIENATNGIDRLYDGYELSETSTRFYSLIEGEKMAIQGKSVTFEDTDKVPLGLVVAQAGNYTIAINTLDGLFESTNQDIYLEDTYTGMIHDLRGAPYSFNSGKGTFDDRFILRYNNVTLSLPDEQALNNLLITAPGNQYIKVSSAYETIKSVSVYDVLGRNLFINNNLNQREFMLNDVPFSNGTYIVEVTLNSGLQKIQKVVINL